MIEIKYNTRVYIDKKTNRITIRVRWSGQETHFALDCRADSTKWDSHAQRPIAGTIHKFFDQNCTARVLEVSIDDGLDQIKTAFTKCMLEGFVPSKEVLKQMIRGDKKEKEDIKLKDRLSEIKTKAPGKVTIIIVAHTNKSYNPDKDAIRLDAIYGSVYYNNLASVIIGISPSDEGKNYKKLTVLKTTGNRSIAKGQVLHEELVDDKYLHFELKWIEKNDEDDDDANDTDSTANAIGITHDMKVEMWKMNKTQSLSYSRIVEEFLKRGISVGRSTVGNYVNEIQYEVDDAYLKGAKP